ncbi:pentatricopeptide repeat-containing protein [Pyrus ussuriensis x Pyrus communis]|uniref:Pentatricopeptide repeat-containing protein n=1 Tax=Pyrus ussuriensis x Pyrus communis TaxID=2448454 RepID=A0A5N5HMT3_9ROSA|nr:pentatricopeptide repeat-containing protein [Pyrus ussuriensis x Pyrus communis]
MASVTCNFTSLSPSSGGSDQRSWNQIARNQVVKRNVEHAFQSYIEMQKLGFSADNYTFPLLLNAAGNTSLRIGLTLHGRTVKTGFCDHLFVQTALLKDSLLMLVRFDKMPERDVGAWNSMLDVYASSGQMDNAMEIFDTVPSQDLASFSIMISGFAGARSVTSARSIFDRIPEKDVVSWNDDTGVHERYTYTEILEQASSPHLITAPIDMYAKCGSIHNSLEVSYKSKNKDIYCWTALISGLALHGFGYAVLKLFDQMRENCIKPDDITFIGVLSSCSHAGLPGSLTRRCTSSRGCRFEPGKSVLGDLLSACVIHQDLEAGEKAMELLVKKGCCLSDGEHMMFSNLYASCGQWEEAGRRRNMMNGLGIVEVEINGRFHKFLAGEGWC